MQVQLIKKEDTYFKKSEERYMRGFEGKKGWGKCNYVGISKNNIKQVEHDRNRVSITSHVLSVSFRFNERYSACKHILESNRGGNLHPISASGLISHACPHKHHIFSLIEGF